MTLLTATLWALLIISILSVIVYFHVVLLSIVVKMLLVTLQQYHSRGKNEIDYFSQMKTTLGNDVFLSKIKYKNIRILTVGFILFFITHLIFFGVFYQRYVNDIYPKAKAYYAVGMIPHNYNMYLARFKSPLYPPFLGINKPAMMMKEFLFDRGKEHIPKRDGERDFWEYMWFYEPYIPQHYNMWGSYVGSGSYANDSDLAKEPEYTHQKQKLEALYELMYAINTKSFRDSHQKHEAKVYFIFMARYYSVKSVALSPFYEYIINPNKPSYIYLYTTKTLVEKERNIERWLETSVNEIESFPEYQNNELNSLFAQAMATSTLLLYYEDNLFIDIFANAFSCESDRVKKYGALREKFLTKSPLTQLREQGEDGWWFYVYNRTIRNLQSEFMRRLLSKKCHISLPGAARMISFSSSLMDINRSVYHEALQMIEEQSISSPARTEEGTSDSNIIVGDGIVTINGMEYQNRDLKIETWESAQKSCQELDLYGKGWRLPNVDELQNVASMPIPFYNDVPTFWYEDKSIQKYRNKDFRGGPYFIKKEFINTITRISPLPKIWTGEEIAYSDFVYVIDFFYAGIKMSEKFQ